MFLFVTAPAVDSLSYHIRKMRRGLGLVIDLPRHGPGIKDVIPTLEMKLQEPVKVTHFLQVELTGFKYVDFYHHIQAFSVCAFLEMSNYRKSNPRQQVAFNVRRERKGGGGGGGERERKRKRENEREKMKERK